MYSCPDCKRPLEQYRCNHCNHEYPCVDGIPILLSKDPRFQQVVNISRQYDSIYQADENVWETQTRRTPEFIRYVSSIIHRFNTTRFLGVGCGQGFLLESVRGDEKFGTELSLEAVRASRARASAQFCLALAERLPFPSDYFDAVLTVGVMEHFLNVDEGLREIARVLKPGGYYVTLVHAKSTLAGRLALKIFEYVLPRPRPLAFLRWLGAKLRSPMEEPQRAVKQPVQNRFATHSARRYLEAHRLNVVDLIHKRRDPSLPLRGPFVEIYVARKAG